MYVGQKAELIDLKQFNNHMERQQDLDKLQKMDGCINNVQNLKLQSEYTNNATYFH